MLSGLWRRRGLALKKRISEQFQAVLLEPVIETMGTVSALKMEFFIPRKLCKE